VSKRRNIARFPPHFPDKNDDDATETGSETQTSEAFRSVSFHTAGYGLMGVKVTILSAEHELSLTNTVDAIRFAASEAVSEAVSHADANAGTLPPVQTKLTSDQSSRIQIKVWSPRFLHTCDLIKLPAGVWLAYDTGMMEPIMRVEVAVSDKFVGAVLNDLTVRKRLVWEPFLC
jgi:translation elongation factor EF-G